MNEQKVREKYPSSGIYYGYDNRYYVVKDINLSRSVNNIAGYGKSQTGAWASAARKVEKLERLGLL